jgi:hypothetical protein
MKYNIDTFAMDDFNDVPPYYLIKNTHPLKKTSVPIGCALFLDQEPIYPPLTSWASKTSDQLMYDKDSSIWEKRLPMHHLDQCIFISEKGKEADWLREKLKVLHLNVPVVYYFYHAYASLDNYRNYWKENITVPTEHDKLFICYQNVINSYRWHRIQFQLRLRQSKLIDQGLVSYNPSDRLEEILTQALNRHQNKEIFNHTHENIDLLRDSYKIDGEEPTGSMSTYIDIQNCQRAFVHVVSETSFYNGKQHLTEKIFKPIVAMQPFLLLGAYGNLAYLRDYGFKTFGDFWDEGYDNITDDVQRIDEVFKILQNLSELSYQEQCALRQEMKPIIEHNANVFYYKLKNTVVNELTTNLKIELKKSNKWKFVKDEDIAHLNTVLKY